VKGANRDTVLRRTVSVTVAPFELDRRPVTNAQYLEFVRAHPQWRRSRVSRLYADASYLRHWRGDLELGEQAPPRSPVVRVSWHAARAYAAAHGGRLPTVAEWELVAAADETRKDATRDPAYLAKLREWYSRPSARVLPSVGTGPPNAWGVQDLHALVWEWTLDFNSALVSGESRGDASLDRSLYCGAGRPTRPTSPTTLRSCDSPTGRVSKRTSRPANSDSALPARCRWREGSGEYFAGRRAQASQERCCSCSPWAAARGPASARR
jgi:formylglycine-generating enzyme required for sulfatase activity